MYKRTFFIGAVLLLLSGCANTSGDGSLEQSSSSAMLSSSSVENTVSDGTLLFAVPSPFGLAVSDEQILTHSYIPPCESGFNYCLYYMGQDYLGTNFETAGLSILRWTNAATQDTCLQQSPDGYANTAPTATEEHDGYATSVFTGLGDAATGHYAHDRLYRLSVGSTCYGFTLRIGESQFANYPEGTIEEFTDADRQHMQQVLSDVLGRVMFADGNRIEFPSVSE